MSPRGTRIICMRKRKIPALDLYLRGTHSISERQARVYLVYLIYLMCPTRAVLINRPYVMEHPAVCTTMYDYQKYWYHMRSV